MNRLCGRAGSRPCDRLARTGLGDRACDALLQVVSSVPQRAGARFGSSSELPALRRVVSLPDVFVTVNAFAAGHLVLSFERSGRQLILAASIGIDLAVFALRNYSFAPFPPVASPSRARQRSDHRVARRPLRAMATLFPLTS